VTVTLFEYATILHPDPKCLWHTTKLWYICIQRFFY